MTDMTPMQKMQKQARYHALALTAHIDGLRRVADELKEAGHASEAGGFHVVINSLEIEREEIMDTIDKEFK